MGQTTSNAGSGFVVEIAPPRLANGWQAVPQCDDEACNGDLATATAPNATATPATATAANGEAAAAKGGNGKQLSWRVTINPQADEFVAATLTFARAHAQANQYMANRCHHPNLGSSNNSIGNSRCPHRNAVDSNSTDNYSSTTDDDSDSDSFERRPRVKRPSAAMPLSTSSERLRQERSMSQSSSGISSSSSLSLESANDRLAKCTNGRHCLSQAQLAPVKLSNCKNGHPFGHLKGFSSEEFRRNINTSIANLYGVSRTITEEEARCIALSLELRDRTAGSDTLLRTLTTIAGLATYIANQNTLRTVGVVATLRGLLDEQSLSNACKVMLMQCIANLAINKHNHELLQDALPVIMRKLGSLKSSELEKMVCVQALTNLSAQIQSHHVPLFTNVIPCLYKRFWSHGKVNYSILKLLANLAICCELVPSLLVAKAPPSLYNMLSTHQSDEVLNHCVNVLLCLLATVQSLGIRGWDDVKQLALDAMGNSTSRKAKSSDNTPSANGASPVSLTEMQSVYFALFGPIGAAQTIRRLELLYKNKNADTRMRARAAAKMLVQFANPKNDGDSCCEEKGDDYLEENDASVLSTSSRDMLADEKRDKGINAPSNSKCRSRADINGVPILRRESSLVQF